MFPSSVVNVTREKELDDDTREPREAEAEDRVSEKKQELPRQEVYVLDGGFVKWQEKWVIFHFPSISQFNRSVEMLIN